MNQTKMSGDHFQEFLYTIMLTTKSDKKDICRYLDISRVTLNKYLRYELPASKRFLIIDQLEKYCSERLGGLESGTIRQSV